MAEHNTYEVAGQEYARRLWWPPFLESPFDAFAERVAAPALHYLDDRHDGSLYRAKLDIACSIPFKEIAGMVRPCVPTMSDFWRYVRAGDDSRVSLKGLYARTAASEIASAIDLYVRIEGRPPAARERMHIADIGMETQFDDGAIERAACGEQGASLFSTRVRSAQSYDPRLPQADLERLMGLRD